MLHFFRQMCGGRRGRRKGKQEQEQTLPRCSMAQAEPTSSHSSDRRVVYQPLHPSVRALMDPEYVTWHEQHLQYVEPDYRKVWKPDMRERMPWPYTGSPIVKVGRVEDIQPHPNFRIRVFTPEGSSPPQGWPLVIWFHGGGFVTGNIHSDNDFCSLACKEIGCVVASVDYRLAPEHPWPAAVEDTTETLRWVASDIGVARLNINRAKIVIAGASAGGNLAAVGALLAANNMEINILLQGLVVPVMDNTATLETLWKSHPYAPGLPAERMTWFRNMYLPRGVNARDWRISPLYAPDTMLSNAPKTFIAIAGQDMLSTEGLAYAEKLKNAGVETEVVVYEGMPHANLVLSGVARKGRQCMEDLIRVFGDAFRSGE